jgi:hypothetical protein
MNLKEEHLPLEIIKTTFIFSHIQSEVPEAGLGQ